MRSQVPPTSNILISQQLASYIGLAYTAGYLRSGKSSKIGIFSLHETPPYLPTFPVSLLAQTLPDSLTGKIDSIFKFYTPTSPGCAVAVTKNGAVVFQKGYGMANLEYAIPVTPNTIFHIASESKQYTAFCILLLEKEGKLSLDDDIRKHLSYVPDFGQKDYHPPPHLPYQRPARPMAITCQCRLAAR